LKYEFILFAAAVSANENNFFFFHIIKQRKRKRKEEKKKKNQTRKLSLPVDFVISVENRTICVSSRYPWNKILS